MFGALDWESKDLSWVLLQTLNTNCTMYFGNLFSLPVPWFLLCKMRKSFCYCKTIVVVHNYIMVLKFLILFCSIHAHQFSSLEKNSASVHLSLAVLKSLVLRIWSQLIWIWRLSQPLSRDFLLYRMRIIISKSVVRVNWGNPSSIVLGT